MPYNIKNILNSYKFEKNSKDKNIYLKLFKALKSAITNGALTDNIKMPPSRILAKDIGISRSTVIKAYELLVVEKYLFSVPGSGYYVSSVNDKKIQQVRFENRVDGKYPKISKRAKSFVNNSYTVNIRVPKGVPFRPGLPPLDIFPVTTWKKLSNDYWKSVKSSELSYSDSYGLLKLREQISEYLKIYRNIDCDSNQIIVTTGSLHSLYLLSNSLIDKNDEVVIENPIYPHAHSLLKSLNAKFCYANIDSEGICINEINCDKPKMVYTTPSNQSPTGVKMSLKRRTELLEWASLKNTVVVEDDYDHEFSNWEKPISALYSLDKQQRVVYLGTFNKLLHPSIRLGYMVVPNFLINPINSIYEQSSRFVPSSIQTIMSSFIEKDHLNVHLRNVIEISQERKRLFITL
ncbi:MAG: PLP-dependent aminotransferase family protein, partial [Flavobacteriaceae bacterium]|nr:PLP-dependent aminotransferase family protein [Flavobacteriaceae bacterium]